MRLNQKWVYSSLRSQSDGSTSTTDPGSAGTPSTLSTTASQRRERQQLGDTRRARHELGSTEQVFDVGLRGHARTSRASEVIVARPTPLEIRRPILSEF